MLGDYQAIAADVDFDTPAVACWIDTRTGSPDPYTVRIRRTRGTSFETWRRLRFSTAQLADPGTSGPSADLDGDGWANFAEYAFGLEPKFPDGPVVSVPGTRFRMERGLISFRYARVRTLADAGFAWQVSSDLRIWQRCS
jgi:hypothetical protein